MQLRPLNRIASTASPGATAVSADSGFAGELRDAMDTEKRRTGADAAFALTATGEATPRPLLELRMDRPRLGEREARALARVVWDARVQQQERVGVRLQAEATGDLELSIGVDADGGVRVEARADDPRVARLLLASREELRSALARWGMRLSGFSAHGPRPAEPAPGAAVHGEPRQTDNPRRGDDSRRSFIEVVI